MRLTAIIQLIYGILTLAGGIIGYTSSKSTVSLIMGIIFGIGILIAAYMLFQNNFTGVYIAMVLSLILLIVFSIRFVSTLSFMPSGLMLILSILALGFAIYAFTQKGSTTP